MQGTIPRDKIDEIRQRADIVEIVRRHVELKRAGPGSWKGLCPFHSEKSPSFYVNEQGFFKCFGCDEKGDVFKFLQRIESLGFMEVVRELAETTGVELPEKQQTPAQRRAMEREASERDRMRRAMSLAVEFYVEQLKTPGAAAARDYLAGRKLSEETLTSFAVGYAPAEGQALTDFLEAQRVPFEDAERLGLVRQNERGPYDFFRDRIMLPVFDRQKRPVGFSARLLDPEAKAAKYVNTQDSPLFHKKALLYGLQAAQDGIRRAGRAIVVEGNFDVMAMHDVGLKETVAPMGTSLTEEQIAMLARMAKHVVVLFDGDDAGERASRRVVPLFVSADIDGRIARLPRGVDPDELVHDERAGGLAAIRELVDMARPVVEQFIDDSVGAAEATVPGRIAALEQAAAVIASVRNPTARELYTSRLAAGLGMAPEQAARAVRAARFSDQKSANVERTSEVVAPSPAPTEQLADELPPPRFELEALALLVGNPELARVPDARRALDLLVHPGLRKSYRIALETLALDQAFDVSGWIEGVPQNARDQLWRLLIDGRFSKIAGADRAMRSLVGKLEVMRIDGELAMVDSHLKQSLQKRDETAVATLSRRKMELITEKQNITETQVRN